MLPDESAEDEEDEEEEEEEEETEVQLEPFIHQVGGHFPMVCLDNLTLCKPLNDRELRIYQTLPDSLLPFTPLYKGTMRVDTNEDENGYITLTGQPPPEYKSRLRRQAHQAGVAGETSSRQHQPSTPKTRLKQRKQSIEIELEGEKNQEELFCNPWALKCHRDHLKKFMSCHHRESSSSSKNGLIYLLIENLVSKYRRPCVLDLKVGTRQYADDVSAAKKQRKIAKCANTTSATLGLRLCGLQVYNQLQSNYVCRNKYFGRSLTPQSFRLTIKQFLTNSNKVFRSDVLEGLIVKLVELKKVLSELESYRFYTSSLLVTYDGYLENFERLPTSENEDVVDVRIIDFAHSTHKGLKDAVLHSGPDDGFIFGLKNFISILENIRSSQHQEETDL